MIKNQCIQVFEHQQLNINEQGFTRSHWEKLGWYNHKYGGRFFTLTPKGVKFSHYVGVIQVGNISIEILPKVGREGDETNKEIWQRVLIDMLQECNWMRVHSNENAALKLKSNSILEAYLEIFIQECEVLLREGLVKKYRTIQGNSSSLKGKLLFSQQIRKNSIHQERSFTQYQVFDLENIFNQILLKAIRIIPGISQHPLLNDRVYNLLLSFPDLQDVRVTHDTFSKLLFGRKTARYKQAVEIAIMLLLNMRPDISNGHHHVLAILFDMNELWEEYIYRQLRKQQTKDFWVAGQESRHFWLSDDDVFVKRIRPDIVITNNSNNKALILDTKWKVLFHNIPADGDLKQMYVYNDYWKSNSAFLVYPTLLYVPELTAYMGSFGKIETRTAMHNCGILKISVLDNDGKCLDRELGKKLYNYLSKLFN
ncbi:restriction endonuclease [Chitinophaga agrisoli]|uniref:Restriction endonuclease n=1 Tax=Chitinophaga agrisoli TaxID=2607653 RepID=A0A5B2VNS8_9BACT|nr:restriction endonuclease [Chitinophaga agrisoli]KAA2240368.1 restriction endonuclease [Chitinophaga agrisoli]